MRLNDLPQQTVDSRRGRSEYFKYLGFVSNGGLVLNMLADYF